MSFSFGSLLNPAALVGEVIGGGLGGDNDKTVTTETRNDPWHPARNPMKDVYHKTQRERTPQYFKHNTYVGRNTTQRNSDRSALDFAYKGMKGNYGTARGIQGSFLDAGANLNWGGQAQRPELQSALTDPTVTSLMDANADAVTQNLTERWMPKAHINSAGVGDMGGSGHAKAQRLALRDASSSLGQANAQTLAEARGQNVGMWGRDLDASINQRSQDLNARGQNIGMLGDAFGYSSDLNGMGLMPSEVMNKVGMMRQLDDQAYRDAAKERWDFGQNNELATLERKAGIYNLLDGGQGSTTTVGANPNYKTGWDRAMDVANIGASVYKATKGGVA